METIHTLLRKAKVVRCMDHGKLVGHRRGEKWNGWVQLYRETKLGARPCTNIRIEERDEHGTNVEWKIPYQWTCGGWVDVSPLRFIGQGGEDVAMPTKRVDCVHVRRSEIPVTFNERPSILFPLFFSPSHNARNAVHREKHRDKIHPHLP